MKSIYSTFCFLLIVTFSNSQIVFNNERAPELAFTGWAKNKNGMNVLKDKHIILEFWARWCGPCIKAIPHFNALTKKYSDDIAFVSINSYESKEVVEQFLKKHEMLSYVALDENQYLKNAFNVQNIPVTIIIDKEGMLRWRGITTELTEEILSTFLEKNIFYNNYDKGIVINKDISIQKTENINFNLKLEYGDRTKGKGLAINYEEEFYLKLANNGIPSFLHFIYGELGLENEWKFEGNVPYKKVFNLEVTSNSSIHKELIYKEIVSQLSKEFNFTIEQFDEIQEIWFVEPDAKLLKEHLSIDQNQDPKVKEQTEEYTLYKNVFFDYLTPIISARTKVKVKYEVNEDYTMYDIKIPKTDDIHLMKKYLKEKYGIDLIKKEVLVKINKVTFH